MKTIDFHLHTKKTSKDNIFDFDVDVLKQYIREYCLDAIAITNHNEFDLEQFKDLKDALDCSVFPGIELDFETGHLIVIANPTQADEFYNNCKQFNTLIGNKSYLTKQQLFQLFPNINDYLLIPHYMKGPKVPTAILNAMKELLMCGEVGSPKKWEVCIKDRESLTPVLFSDFRPHKGVTDFPARQTYISCDELTISKLKIALSDKTKVFICTLRTHS